MKNDLGMSDNEQVQYFNPIMILVWIIQLLIVGMDYSKDQRISWSIPIIGSVLLIQIFMIWKTNYDEMMAERREAMGKKYGGALVNSTPVIQPGTTNLAMAQQKSANFDTMVDLDISSNLKSKKNDQEKTN